MLIKCGKYTLRYWEEGDGGPKNFHCTFVLDYENKQVGAIAGDIDDIWGIETRPQGKGHGTNFIKMMMKEAKCRGKTIFKVQDVKSAPLERILRDKLGFEQAGNKTWIKKL